MSGRQSSRPTLRCDACISILRASGTIGRIRQSSKLERTYPSALLDLSRSKSGPCTGKSDPPTEQGALLVAVWVMLLALFSVHLAEAHGDHQWIANGDLHDPVSGQWCCGDNDCHVVDDAAVIYVGTGYYVRERNDSGFEFIEEQRALPLSPDGRIHRCVEHGYVDDAVYTRCFIVPPKTM